MRGWIIVFGFGILFAIASDLLAGETKRFGLTAGPSGARSVGEFVTADGRIDLDLARRFEYEGSLNLDGFRVTLDGRTGEPRVQPAAAVSRYRDSRRNFLRA